MLHRQFFVHKYAAVSHEGAFSPWPPARGRGGRRRVRPARAPSGTRSHARAPAGKVKDDGQRAQIRRGISRSPPSLNPRQCGRRHVWRLGSPYRGGRTWKWSWRRRWGASPGSLRIVDRFSGVRRVHRLAVRSEGGRRSDRDSSRAAGGVLAGAFGVRWVSRVTRRTIGGQGRELVSSWTSRRVRNFRAPRGPAAEFHGQGPEGARTSWPSRANWRVRGDRASDRPPPLPQGLTDLPDDPGGAGPSATFLAPPMASSAASSSR